MKIKAINPGARSKIRTIASSLPRTVTGHPTSHRQASVTCSGTNLTNHEVDLVCISIDDGKGPNRNDAVQYEVSFSDRDEPKFLDDLIERLQWLRDFQRQTCKATP